MTHPITRYLLGAWYRFCRNSMRTHSTISSSAFECELCLLSPDEIYFLFSSSYLVYEGGMRREKFWKLLVVESRGKYSLGTLRDVHCSVYVVVLVYLYTVVKIIVHHASLSVVFLHFPSAHGLL